MTATRRQLRPLTVLVETAVRQSTARHTRFRNGVVWMTFAYRLEDRVTHDGDVARETVLTGPRAVLFGGEIRRKIRGSEVGRLDLVVYLLLWALLPVLSLVLTVVTLPLWLLFRLVLWVAVAVASVVLGLARLALVFRLKRSA